MEYEDFIESKIVLNINSGFDIEEKYLNKSLFDYQKEIVIRACKKGKYALFMVCRLSAGDRYRPQVLSLRVPHHRGMCQSGLWSGLSYQPGPPGGCFRGNCRFNGCLRTDLWPHQDQGLLFPGLLL